MGIKKKIGGALGGGVLSVWALKELYDSILQAIRDNTLAINGLIELHLR
jgi:hypothetical protein